MPLISRVADKGIVGAIRGVTAIALFAGLGGSALDHLMTLTMRAQHRNENHEILLVKTLSIMAHFGLKSPLLKHAHLTVLEGDSDILVEEFFTEWAILNRKFPP
jgi:hypothetical protein